MKKSLEEINLEMELEHALNNGNEYQVNEILNLLAESIPNKDVVRLNFNSLEELKSERNKNFPAVTTDLTRDNIQHLLKNALENGDAKMVDYYMFLLGEGV